MKKKIKYLIIILVFFISIFIIEIIRMNNQVKAFDKTPIDISQVADGVYNGHSETDLVKVEVKVTVEAGAIKDIEILKHECGKGRPANVIVNDMVKKNDVEVDGVSGATFSSEVIKDAVRDALRKGM